MNACILSIGDELVLGQTVDTNTAWIAKQMAAVGCEIVAHATVGDGQLEIETAIRELSQRADVLVISGGIGPTEDDLTRQALSAVLDAPLDRNDEWMAVLETYFARTNRKMPEINKVQAMIPRGATMIYNHAGTAAGVRARLGTCEIFSTPGVPKEMKAMFERDVLPWLVERGGGAVIASRILHTFGLGESAVGERLGALMTRGRNPSVGTTVSGGFVSLRLNVRAASREEADRQLNDTEAACREVMGELVFGRGDETLQGAVLTMLKAAPNQPTVATAESCTGGLLAKMLTDLPGSSAIFRYGWVTYANAAKTSELGVPEALLNDVGAVSEPVARAMAEGARQKSGSTYALAITGIAGPDGGTADKPVGTVWIALASASGTLVRRFNTFGDREMIRDRSAKMAITMLRYELLGKPFPFGTQFNAIA
ncbi:MAG TPA: competence/damage-inducible protein A [Tepidisphaeraceae bacterium]|jgi:nicotinamide-nucleotide amidase|nr:competence/damage-inducible protein A [Tepidisphaeraceae bacterium]